MRTPRQACSSLLVLLALAAPAAAVDPVPGTYQAAGSHSSYGAYTGDVTVAPAGTRWSLRGTYSFAGGRRVSWTGDAVKNGGRLEVVVRYQTGLAGAIGGGNGRRATGGWTIGPDGRSLSGSWRATSYPRHRFTETLTLQGAGPGPSTVAVDLQGQRDGAFLGEDKEETDGIVVGMNLDDDDRDGGAGGDGETRIVRDQDDPNGTSGENDLVQVRLVKPQGAPAGASFRLAFGANVAVYRGADRTGPVAAGASLPVDGATLHVEGRTFTAAAGTPLALELVSSSGQVLGRDVVTVHVAKAAFILGGHGGTGNYGVRNEARRRAIDKRTDPTYVKGKDASGKPLYWAVYVWETEKQAKIALSTPGAVISYDGHSNFGMGFAFQTGFSRLSQFMNIADAQIPVNWPYLRDHQDHPQLLFSDAEYGDDPSTPGAFDPTASSVVIPAAKSPLRKTRWGAGGSQRFTLTRGTSKWLDHHFGSDDNIRIVVKAGSKDMPEKRWDKLFLNSCYSGSYYIDSFGGHGTLFFTTDEASASTTSAAFLFGYIDGKSDDDVCDALNDIENINDYKVFGATP